MHTLYIRLLSAGPGIFLASSVEIHGCASVFYSRQILDISKVCDDKSVLWVKQIRETELVLQPASVQCQAHL